MHKLQWGPQDSSHEMPQKKRNNNNKRKQSEVKSAYSNIVKTQDNTKQKINAEVHTKIFPCIIPCIMHAHLVNNLPTIKAPSNPPSAGMLVSAQGDDQRKDLKP